MSKILRAAWRFRRGVKSPLGPAGRLCTVLFSQSPSIMELSDHNICISIDFEASVTSVDLFIWLSRPCRRKDNIVEDGW